MANDDIIRAINQRQALYEAYAAPQFNYREYSQAISNIPNLESAPDNYSIGDHFRSAYYSWYINML